MTRCSGCGEPLPKEGEACPVCDTLNLPDAQIFDAANGDVRDDQDDAAQNTGPILGANQTPRSNGETVRITKPVLPEKKAEKATEAAAAPVLKRGNDDYEKRFEEEAQIYGSDAYNIKRIEELRRRAVPIVLFMGMRTTGKTWLIQRMKHMLEAQFECYPAVKLTHRAIESDAITNADESEQRQKYLGRTDLSKAELERQAATDSGRTSAMIFHEFQPVEAGNGKEFVLVDVPGEDFRLLAEGQFSAIRSLACALKYAGTVIVALPSDITLLGSRVSASEFSGMGNVESVRTDHEFVEKLTGSLADMSKMRSILLSKNVAVKWKPEDGEPDAYDHEITAEALRGYTWANGRLPFGGEDGMGCPVYIALTKADKFFAASGKLPDLRNAPEGFAPKLEQANENLRKAPDGPLFEKLFQTSALNLRNLLEKPGWLSDALKVLVGKRSHVAPISNPPEMLLQANDKLFNRLNANFPMSRIDLVAAFYGHTGNTLCLSDLEDFPEIGVKQMTDWLAKVHDDGITVHHGWARSAFARIYRADSQMAGPAGGAKRKIHNWRLRFLPPQMLAGMYRKEFHPLQIAPAFISTVAAISAVFLTFSWLESTATLHQTSLYDAFKKEVEAANSRAAGQGGQISVPALVALPALPEIAQKMMGKVSAPYAKTVWKQVDELTSWSINEDGDGYAVLPPKDIPADIAPPSAPPANKSGNKDAQKIYEAEKEIANLRPDQLKWQSRYVCGLEGWGVYRDIIRKAAINGYGDCSGITRLAMRSPMVDSAQQLLGWWPGALVGFLLLAAIWAGAVATILYTLWFHKTRSAYGWLYHSGVATTQRETADVAESREK
jgi:hypothetical protein